MVRCTGVTTKGIRCYRSDGHVRHEWKFGCDGKLERCSDHKDSEKHYDPKIRVNTPRKGSVYTAPDSRDPSPAPSARRTPTRSCSKPRTSTPSRNVSFSDNASITKMERTLTSRDTGHEVRMFGADRVAAAQRQGETARRHVKRLASWQDDSDEEVNEHIKATTAINNRVDTQEWQTHIMAGELVEQRDTLDVHKDAIHSLETGSRRHEARIDRADTRIDELAEQVESIRIRTHHYVDDDD